MKAIFIAYDQAHHENILEALSRSNCRGFTGFDTVQGRGTNGGEPHYGTHAWPSLAGAILTMVDDEKVDNLLERLRRIDDNKPKLGLRAFVWDIEKTI
jgi:nitrogen regulatory protein PII